jgi:hypothetical protein
VVHDHRVSVSPFIGEYKPLQDIPIASVATAWDNPRDGSAVLLVINEALYFGDRMPYSLICPNQLRNNGIVVNDVPKIFDPESTQSIIIPDAITLPLHMRGMLTYLPTRKPSDRELRDCDRYELTSAAPWDPYEASIPTHGDWGPYAVSYTCTMVDPPELDVERMIGSFALLNASEPHEADVIAHGNGLNFTSGISAMSRDDRQSTVSKQDLAKRWHIGFEAAARTLQTTTQEGMRFVQGKLERRLRTSQAHLRYPSLRVTIYTDTLFPSVKSIRGYTCAQLFTDGHCFARVYPLKRKGDAHHALVQFIQDIGIPKSLLTDCAPEEMHGEWGRVVKKYHIKPKMTEPASPWQNRAEAEIREVKKLACRAIHQAVVPIRFWCYALEWAAKVRSLTAHDLPFLATRTPEERILGQTPDISEYAHFEWMQWVWYRNPAPFPEEDLQLGRWLGVAQDVGQAMTYWILTRKGAVVARSSVVALSTDDFLDESLKLQKETFMTRCIPQSEQGASESKSLEVFPDLIDNDPVFTTPEMDEYTPDAYDEYIRAQVILPVGGELRRGEVLRRKRDHDGRPIGTRNSNPLLDTRKYEVSFADGGVDSYTANVLAEGIYSQVDQEGRMYMLLSEIVDHDENKDITSKARSTYTTKGWRFLIAWKDGSTSYVPLREMKNAYPLETAEYAIANGLDQYPAFKWWVPAVYKKRSRMISKLKKNKTKYWHRSHKYGIELPKSVAEALAIDAKTGTTFWRDAIDKEMRNVSPAFEFINGDVSPIGYKHIPCHMVFDIKMVGLVRKARLVAGGHLIDPPVESVYSSVITHESVRIMFLIAALNDLDILGADVQNAYINAKTNEKVYTTAGPEFGSNEGRPAIIIRALYGLKSSGARWRDHFAAILRQLGFKSSKADPDVWMRKAKKSGGFVYWEYILCYVDDVLVIGHQSQATIESISQHVTFKKGSIQPPANYLGANIAKCTLLDGNDTFPNKQVWTMSAQDYIKQAVEEVERELKLNGSYLPKKIETPFSHGYHPELDFSNELGPEKVNYFQGLIGVLRWIVELGRIDIIVPVSLPGVTARGSLVASLPNLRVFKAVQSPYVDI